MREKINELRDQEQEIADEIKMNEELGKKVKGMVESKATQSEFSKYELFIGELNKIVALLLSLTQRLHRYEMMLQDLDMTNESDKIKKVRLKVFQKEFTFHNSSLHFSYKYFFSHQKRLLKRRPTTKR